LPLSPKKDKKEGKKKKNKNKEEEKIHVKENGIPSA
jgi:hypothetical protein